jgi:predicted NAD/FAD-binding protein
MVYPLTALFFGTGNQTPYVSSAIIARVFLDSNLKLFDYDNELLLSEEPDFFVFPNLKNLYSKLKLSIESQNLSNSSNGKIQFHLNTKVNYVDRKIDEKTNKPIVNVHYTSIQNNNEMKQYDKIIFACDASTALQLLNGNESRMERFVLGNVKYYHDVTVTHTDTNYMKKHYEIDLDKDGRKDQYLIKVDKDDPHKLEMSFNLTNYQPQLFNSETNIFQTIFLDKNQSEKWTKSQIGKDKILIEKWWKQFSHTWKHFASVIPFVRFIEGSYHNSTWYCGSYTLMNTHEMAVISGFACVSRILGKETYPFPNDKLAKDQFDTYMKFVHGC